MSLVEWASAPQFVIVTIASLLAVVSAMMMVTRRDVVRKNNHAVLGDCLKQSGHFRAHHFSLQGRSVDRLHAL